MLFHTVKHFTQHIFSILQKKCLEMWTLFYFPGKKKKKVRIFYRVIFASGELITSFTAFFCCCYEIYTNLDIKRRALIGMKTIFNCISPDCSKLPDYFICLYYWLLCRSICIRTNINRFATEKQWLKRFHPFSFPVIISQHDMCSCIAWKRASPAFSAFRLW